MWLCIDYQQLNSITINNEYPLPCIDNLFYQLEGTTIFFRIDPQSGYHQPKVKNEDKPKTTFQT